MKGNTPLGKPGLAPISRPRCKGRAHAAPLRANAPRPVVPWRLRDGVSRSPSSGCHRGAPERAQSRCPRIRGGIPACRGRRNTRLCRLAVAATRREDRRAGRGPRPRRPPAPGREARPDAAFRRNGLGRCLVGARIAPCDDGRQTAARTRAPFPRCARAVLVSVKARPGSPRWELNGTAGSVFGMRRGGATASATVRERRRDQPEDAGTLGGLFSQQAGRRAFKTGPRPQRE
jgi:hypothetical protein